MERMRSEDRRRTVAGVHDDARGRLAAESGMLVFLIGLAVLFVVNAPR